MHVFYTPDIQTHAELPEEEAAHAVRVLRLQAGDEVMLTGFGCFSARRKPARTMLSFGKEIEVPAKKSIVFKAGRTLKDAVN